jgi:hypothetical protein
MEVTMHENFLYETGHPDSSHLANTGDLDEAISTSPLEHLKRCVVTLEQKVRGDPLANGNQNPPGTKQ